MRVCMCKSAVGAGKGLNKECAGRRGWIWSLESRALSKASPGFAHGRHSGRNPKGCGWDGDDRIKMGEPSVVRPWWPDSYPLGARQ